MKKIIKIITITIIALILNIAIFSHTVQAIEQQQISIYTKGNFDRFLKYNGVLIKTANAVYADNGKEYPAYCLNVELTGVGDKIETYETINNGKITDKGLWRVIINGYPYKSFEQLGVFSEDEAYTATKQAIYCYIYNRDTSGYEGTNDAGNRTLNAMRIILENAKNSTETLEVQSANIISDEKWKEENEYIIKNYQLKSNINI